MKTQISDLFKGIVIGVANVIPGISGGTLAVVLNIYDKFVHSFKNLLSHPWKTIKKIWGLLLGIIIGIIISAIIIESLVSRFPIPTMMLFVGLIIGTIPRIYQNIKDEQKTIIDLLSFLGFIIILVVLPFLPGTNVDIEMSLKVFIILFFIGVIGASAMVIPGISGSMVLLVLGYYTYILNIVNGFFDTVITFQIEQAMQFLIPLIPFGIGILLGIVFFSKIISNIIKKYRRTFYCAIIGLLVASPFAIIYSMINEYGEQMRANLIFNIIIGIVMLIIGAIISLYMNTINSESERE